MTDKQIIIDGVDVAKCRCFTSKWDFNNCGHICKGTECKYKRLWYKKQLKRKEQECEELKRLISKQKNAKIQLSKLKDKQYKEFCDMKQTLIEIKEIAEDAKTKVFVDMEEFWKQILQKISECEVEE